MRMLFLNNWRFHNGEIDVMLPSGKGPVYTQSKTESYRTGPAAVYYDDRPRDYGMPGKALTHERWELVTLPHDYIINSPVDPDGNEALGFYKYNPAWYRKHFKADDRWRGSRVEIEFLGVSTECEVYFNGVYMKSSRSAYTPFVVDITDFLKFGGEDNVIAVHVTCKTIENWWYNGAGICHKVYLNVTNPVAIERYGVYIAPKKGDSDVWSVPIEVEVHNDRYIGTHVEINTEIFDPNGLFVTSVSAETEISPRSLAKVEYSARVAFPMLWDVDSPSLYRAKTTVIENGEPTDTKFDNFGFRTIEFTPNDGFFLNGRRVQINGVCAHEDFSLTGKAVPDNIMRYKIRMLKDMGANAYRCAHSMQDEAVMDAFDKYGMLCMAETRHFSTAPEHMEELRALVKRDRNRPSVFMWSIGNEEHYFITDEGRRIAENMTFEVKRLDNTRPVMTANDKSPEKCTVYDTCDLVAVNYNPGLYDLLHEKYPNKPLFSSECAASGGTRGWYYGDVPETGRRNIYDKEVNSWFQGHEQVYKIFRDKPWIMGSFLWAGIEHLGEAAWPRLCSSAGVIDLYLQKKDSFYQMKSFFTDEPMVHLLPHWNMEGEGTVKVYAYDNCASVELFLNGRSLGCQKSERVVHHEWDVPFEAGTLACVGYDGDGREIARAERVTAGKPYALKLRLENADDLCYNNEDLALFTCYVVDEKGIEVPDADPMVSFIADEGHRIVGTGSDNTDHNPPCCHSRKMWANRITVAVLPGKSGEMSLTAKASGLKTAKITVDIPEDTYPLPGRVYPKFALIL